MAMRMTTTMITGSKVYTTLYTTLHMVDMSTAEGMQRALHVNSIATWQPDGDVKACLNCGTRFDFVIRRHHCRCCGGIFCGRCCSAFLRYDAEKVKVVRRDAEGPAPALPAPHGKYTSRQRTCISCSSTLKRANLVQVSEPSQQSSTVITDSPTATPPTHPPNIKTSRIREHSQQIDGDVSEDQSITQSTDRSVTPSGEDESAESQDEDAHCPICNVDLSALASDEEREDHIQQCIRDAEDIQQHRVPATSGAPLSPDATEANPVMRNRMLVYRIPPAAAEEEGVEPVTYKECPICFEEMLPGEKVGRLECLCVFHYKCIKSWFNKKTQKMQQQHSNTSFIGKNFCPFHDAIF